VNLALEYLVRTKSIRNFFKTPSSLFLERGEDKIVVTFDGTIGECIRIRRWHLADRPVGHLLPNHLSVMVPEENLFDADVVVPQGYYILNYFEEAVDTSLNSYKKPMAAEVYGHFINNMLYSEPHRYAKEHWLWEAFYNLLPAMSKIRFPDKGSLAVDYADHGHEKHPWRVWSLWKETFLPDRDYPAACELIFMS
jgi:hypothetical protein